ncbi:MAG: hypothetical protein HYZ45_00680, partial [Burkholderiales bacterium]|nr:hypothetical protein [Burkholderiales bacterium]
MAFKLPFGSKDKDSAEHEDMSVSDADHLSTQQFNTIMPTPAGGDDTLQLGGAKGESTILPQPAVAAASAPETSGGGGGRDLRLP